MRRGWRTAVFLFAFAWRAAAQGPAADWRTLETEHFRVHFPAPFEAWARRAAGQIEDIRARVEKAVGRMPSGRIEVVVADPEADANGAAVPWLDRPEIVLWAYPPGSDASTGEFSDWTELLATHEIVHIAHLARPGAGALGLLERLSPAPFGSLTLRSPRWLIEGYATLLEGTLTGSGRPSSVYRAMVLRQFAIEGRLPDYARLNRGSGWIEGSMAYLAGSAFLEWLAARAGPDALPRIFERMERGEGFPKAFAAVYRESPDALYERFRGELTRRACEQEERLRRVGLVEGTLWLRLEGGTSALALSSDGSRLLARRDPGPRESFLAIYDAEAGASQPRSPRWTLPRVDGFAASDPRWMPDGGSVLFARRSPDAGGALRLDLFRWDFQRGSVVRVTRGADVADADPAPDGRTAIAVRQRHGVSALVRVDLASGRAEDLEVPGPLGGWPVWSHPRFSPDGTRVAALLHRGRRWRLVTVPAEGGEATEIATVETPVSAPAWSADGRTLWVTTAGSGIWNVAEVDAAGGGAVARLRTRVTGGAFSPAPASDGKTTYFLELRATGVNIRTLDLSEPGPAAAPEGSSEDPTDADPNPAYPILPPPRVDAVAPSPAAASLSAPPSPYSAWTARSIRSLVNFSLGPGGSAVQLGVDSGDVVGRLHWLALASLADAAGPRGGTIAAAWRGLPVAFSLQLFSALEKPGSQTLVARADLDEERRGGYAGAAWTRAFSGGRVSVEAGGGATRIEALAGGERFTRALGSTRARLSLRRTRGRSGLGLDLEATASAGATNGASWSQAAGGGRVLGITPFATLSAGGRSGGMGGSPTRFDVFAIGGAPSAILPLELDRNRIESPAMPAAVQRGNRFETWRAELSLAAVPLAFYSEWLRAWSPGQARPDPARAVGAELRLERLIPSELDRAVTFRLGVAWITSDTPRLRAYRGYAALIYRP